VAMIRSWRPDLLEEFGVVDNRRSDGVVRLVPPWSDPLGGGVRDACWRGTHPSKQRSGDHPVSTQPLRRPEPQHRLHTVMQSRI
jgi:hypothetical protein